MDDDNDDYNDNNGGSPTDVDMESIDIDFDDAGLFRRLRPEAWRPEGATPSPSPSPRPSSAPPERPPSRKRRRSHVDAPPPAAAAAPTRAADQHDILNSFVQRRGRADAARAPAIGDFHNERWDGAFHDLAASVAAAGAEPQVKEEEEAGAAERGAEEEDALAREAAALAAAAAPLRDRPGQHPQTLDAAPLHNPQQFSASEQRRHAAFVQNLQELAINSLLKVRAGGEDADEAAADGELFMSRQIDLFRDVLTLVERDIPPPPDVYTAGASLLPDVPDLTRLYLRDFLREAVPEHGERDCMFGADCVSVAMCRAKFREYGATKQHSETTFVLRELLLPRHAHQLEVAALNGKAPADACAELAPQPCLLCSRSATSLLAVALGTHHESSAYQTVVQSHGNLFDREGEYRTDRALLLVGSEFHGIIKPIVRFDRRHYERITVTVRVGALASRSCGAWAETQDIIFFASQLQQLALQPGINDRAHLPEGVAALAPYGAIYGDDDTAGAAHGDADPMALDGAGERDGDDDGAAAYEDDLRADDDADGY